MNDSGRGARSVNRLEYVIPSYVLLPTIGAGSFAPFDKTQEAAFPFRCGEPLIERPFDLVDAKRLQ
jgi:hypothetical protein